MQTQQNSTRTSRRRFIKRSVVAGLGAAFLPAYLTSARAADNPQRPPSQRVNLGCVGVGGRAAGVIPSLCKDGLATPVALTDVDFEGSRNIEKNLAAYPTVKRFNDFRVMLDEMGNDIDAVSVVIPDQSHFTAAIAAMAVGKHVYVEKPLTHTFEEAEILMRAEKKFGVVTQMGNQGHTGAGIDLFSEMVDLGLCDKVTKMFAWKTPSLWFMKADQRLPLPLPVDPVPASLNNYDLWCGPRRKLPYNKLFHPFSWRGFYEFGMGMLGDWGAHIIDYAHDKLDMGLPTEIKALRMDDHNRTYFPLTSHLSMHFPARGKNRPAIDMVWKDGADCQPEIPERFLRLAEGADGKLLAGKIAGAGTLLYGEDDDFAILRGHHGDAPRIIPEDQHAKFEAQRGGERPKEKEGHSTAFIKACMGEGTTNSRFSIAGKLAQVLALGAICQYLNTGLIFDPETRRFVGNDEANVLLNPPARKEWRSFYNLA